MKLKKFPQSCLMFESGDTKLLVDPGVINFEEKFLEEWQKAGVVCLPATGGCMTMTPIEAMYYSKMVGAKTAIITHLEKSFFPTTEEKVKECFNQSEVICIVPRIGEEIEI